MQAATPPSRAVTWYRTPLDSKDFKSLHVKSDALGFLQSGGFLALITATGATAYYAAGRLPWWAVVMLVFLHGTVCAFTPNANHELGHGTVFKTKFLNELFMRIFSFIGWHNFEMFNSSHIRHHRYTLHVADDREVILPQKVLIKHFFQQGFIRPLEFFRVIKGNLRIACDGMNTDWELVLVPKGSPQRRGAVNWSRTLLIGHGLIIAVSIYFHLWMLPVVTTFASFYGAWLFFLCNSTQHIGLQDEVDDFRLNTRTFTVNPVVQFLYWHMNFHTDHHMYAAVPCYRLGRLHRLIKHDLPPCPHGLVATWKEIAAIMKIQESDPTYEHVALIPSPRPTEPEKSAVLSA